MCSHIITSIILINVPESIFSNWLNLLSLQYDLINPECYFYSAHRCLYKRASTCAGTCQRWNGLLWYGLESRKNVANRLTFIFALNIMVLWLFARIYMALARQDALYFSFSFFAHCFEYYRAVSTLYTGYGAMTVQIA